MILYQRAWDPGTKRTWVSCAIKVKLGHKALLLCAPAPHPPVMHLPAKCALDSVCWNDWTCDKMTLPGDFSEKRRELGLQGRKSWGPREETGGWGLSSQEWVSGCWGQKLWEQLGRHMVLSQLSGTEFHLQPREGGLAFFSERAPRVMAPKCTDVCDSRAVPT